MNSTEITEGNKLIAEFMGLEIYKDIFYKLPIELRNAYGIRQDIPLEGLIYHESWDWLMPVVGKCFEKYDLIENNSSNHQFKLNDALIEVNINSLWRTVVEFIKYYNKQKQQ